MCAVSWFDNAVEEINVNWALIVIGSILFVFIYWLRGKLMVKQHLELEFAERQKRLQAKERETYISERRNQELVWLTSPRLKELKSLNEIFNRKQFRNGLEAGFPSVPEKIQIVVNSKYYFERYDFKQGIAYAIKKALKDDSLLKHTKKAMELEEEYLAALEKLPPFVTSRKWAEMTSGREIAFEEYVQVERALYEKYSKVGQCDWKVGLEVKYPGKDGELPRWKCQVYEREDLLKIWKAVEKGIGSSEYQRMLVTPKIRYQILRRDNFKCQICGRSSAETKLHVDHIRPISKGGSLGKNYDNLRTLCELCNIGKSDFYDVKGLN